MSGQFRIAELGVPMESSRRLDVDGDLPTDVIALDGGFLFARGGAVRRFAIQSIGLDVTDTVPLYDPEPNEFFEFRHTRIHLIPQSDPPALIAVTNRDENAVEAMRIPVPAG